MIVGAVSGIDRPTDATTEDHVTPGSAFASRMIKVSSLLIALFTADNRKVIFGFLNRQRAGRGADSTDGFTLPVECAACAIGRGVHHDFLRAAFHKRGACWQN